MISATNTYPPLPPGIDRRQMTEEQRAAFLQQIHDVCQTSQKSLPADMVLTSAGPSAFQDIPTMDTEKNWLAASLKEMCRVARHIFSQTPPLIADRTAPDNRCFETQIKNLNEHYWDKEKGAYYLPIGTKIADVCSDQSGE